MAQCEDFPCCGHEMGCCPDYDESGRQMNMVCPCGAKLPADNPVSMCDACLRRPGIDTYDDGYGGGYGYYDGDEEYDYDEDLYDDEGSYIEEEDE